LFRLLICSLLVNKEFDWQVLFTLLCNPGAVNRPYRELADMAGVAHGTVGTVIPDLQQLGFVGDLKGKRGTRRLFEFDRLLDEWATTYARVVRPRTLLGRYYVPTLEGWKDWLLAEYGALWGGRACCCGFDRLPAPRCIDSLRRERAKPVGSSPKVHERACAWPCGSGGSAQALLEFPWRPSARQPRTAAAGVCRLAGNGGRPLR
jgi:hypothetical protein